MENEIQRIHESFLNGNREYAAAQVEDFGVAYFWGDYRKWLTDEYGNKLTEYVYFADMVNAYFKDQR